MVAARKFFSVIVLVLLLFIGLTNYVFADMDAAQLWDNIAGGNEESLAAIEEIPSGTSSIRTTAEEVTRAECLLGRLPDEVDTFGYMPGLPRRMEDPGTTKSSLRVRGREYGIYYLTQWALSPRTITFYDSHPWIIANYTDRADGLAAVAEAGYSIVEDCGNGVFLLKK